MKDKVRNGKVLGKDKRLCGWVGGGGAGEMRESGEAGKPSLCRWLHHHPNALVIAAIHYGMCGCLVHEPAAHPSLSASGSSMTKP